MHKPWGYIRRPLGVNQASEILALLLLSSSLDLPELTRGGGGTWPLAAALANVRRPLPAARLPVARCGRLVAVDASSPLRAAQYLYMLCYIHEKDPTEYNGWEQYVASKLASGDVDFLPRNGAIVLREHSLATPVPRDDARARSAGSRLRIVRPETKAAGKGGESRRGTREASSEIEVVTSSQMSAESRGVGMAMTCLYV